MLNEYRTIFELENSMKKVILTIAMAVAAYTVYCQPSQSDTAKKKTISATAQQKQQEMKKKKEEKHHRDKIAKSKFTGKGVTSRDTLYCAGKPYCIGKEVSHNLLGSVNLYHFHSFKPSNDEIKVSLESVSSGSSTVYYWVWQYKDTRFETEQKESPAELVCYYYLFKDSVFNAKNFNSLKQNKAKSISGYNGSPAPKNKNDETANRNRNDKLVFTGRDIRQSSVLIGHIETSTLTKDGSIITSYLIYNPAGNLVASANNHGVTDHEWDIVTTNDKRNHHVSSSLMNDQDDVVMYLVKLSYL
jgi:hypothetical protein